MECLRSSDVQKISDLKATTTNYDKALVRFFEQAQKDAPMRSTAVDLKVLVRTIHSRTIITIYKYNNI